MDRIVVGVDGSEHGVTALHWAFREAALRDAELTAVLAWDYLGQARVGGDGVFDPDFDESDAQAALDRIVLGALGEDDAARVGRRPVLDLPVAALLQESVGASMLVLGARGLGGFKGLLLGSVSQRCLREATCTVAIVRMPSPRAVGTRTALGGGAEYRRIVVGIDGSQHGDAALHWAAGEASLRGATLRVVHTAQPTFIDLPLVDSMRVGEWAAKQAASMIEQSVARAGIPSSLPLERVCGVGSAAAALLEACDDSDLVVLGRSGRAGLRGALVGSVAVQVSHHTPVPAIFVSAGDAPG